MNLDSCFKIGQIVKAHGVKGEIVLEVLDSNHSDILLELESVFLETNQKLIPFFIDAISVTDKRAIIKFEDIDSSDDAKPLIKKNVYVSREHLPEDEGDRIYYEELIGFKIQDQTLGEIGTVTDFIERTGQDLLVAELNNGKEFYIPIDVAIILEADREKKILITDLPEGLLEL